jgi:hypothetical protein
MAADRRSRDSGNYHAFLVRVSRADANHPWETVVKDVETGEEYPLPDPDGLFQFLTERLPIDRLRAHASDGGRKKSL